MGTQKRIGSSIKDVLYGRFYWYTKFLCRYEAIYGKNGSMEQEQFKIIEFYLFRLETQQLT